MSGCGDCSCAGPDDGLGRHFLHASSIAFVDPLTEEQVTVSSPLPEDLARFVDALRSHAAHASPEV